MSTSGPRVTARELALLVALAAYGLFPLVALLAHAASLHARFTGADGLIGADGVLGADQLQYLAWVRDAASHGLASDLFSLSPSGHVYLQPVFAISGALLHLGLSLPLAYLVWKPVAIVAMFAAAVAWARRMFGAQRAARVAVVALSLFLYTPLTALFSWTQMGASSFRFHLYLLGYELLDANKLWGYIPSALGLAIVPVVLLAAERALDRDRGGRSGVRPVAVAGSGALLASWLHPWQGITLIVILGGLAVVRRGRGWTALAVPAVAAALPLGYYYLLSHSDPAWRLAAHYEVIGRLPALVLLAGLGPPAAIAAFGVRRPGGVVIEQALLLWAGACLVTYVVNDSFAPHALQGLSMPLAVLAVRGWQRLRLPAVLGVAAIALATLPGLAFDSRKFIRTANSSTLVQYYLPASDAQALDWVTAHAPPGGVLAPTPFAVTVPGQTGRRVWVGHGYWSRDYPDRAREVDRLFDGRLRPATAARAFVTSTGARLLIADCRHHADLARTLRPLVASTHVFGCARVYILRSASR